MVLFIRASEEIWEVTGMELVAQAAAERNLFVCDSETLAAKSVVGSWSLGPRRTTDHDARGFGPSPKP